MNMALAEVGKNLGRLVISWRSCQRGLLVDDVVSKSKILTASASDARMAGLPYPAMASGGSGNQGSSLPLFPIPSGGFTASLRRQF